MHGFRPAVEINFHAAWSLSSDKNTMYMYLLIKLTHNFFVFSAILTSLGSRREAFLSQNIRTYMGTCSFTLNPAFHQNSKIFSYNLALPLIYCSTDHRPYRKHWQEIEKCQRVCIWTLGWFELEAVCKHRPSSWCLGADPRMVQISTGPPPLLTDKSCKFSLF